MKRPYCCRNPTRCITCNPCPLVIKLINDKQVSRITGINLIIAVKEAMSLVFFSGRFVYALIKLLDLYKQLRMSQRVANRQQQQKK